MSGVPSKRSAASAGMSSTVDKTPPKARRLVENWPRFSPELESVAQYAGSDTTVTFRLATAKLVLKEIEKAYRLSLSEEEKDTIVAHSIDALLKLDQSVLNDPLLSLLCGCDSGNPKQDDPYSEEFNKEQIQALQGSWTAPYQNTKAIDALFEEIGRCMDSNHDLYARHLSVVQSSGTGKSRLVHEATGHVFGVVINFNDPGAQGYPKCDANVRDYFFNAHDTGRAAEQFFIALFTKLEEVIKVHRVPAMLKDFLAYGNSDKQQQRKEFFDSIIADAKKLSLEQSPFPGGGSNGPIESNNPASLNRSEHPGADTEAAHSAHVSTVPEGDQSLLSVLGSAQSQKLASTTSESTNESPPSYRFLTAQGPTTVTDAVERLFKSGKFPLKGDVKFLIAFDEAGEMTSRQSSKDTKMQSIFTIIRRVLRALQLQPVCTLFMATTGSVEQFYPPPHKEESRRMQSRKFRLHPPFFLTDLEVMGGDNYANAYVSIQTACSLEFILRLGRPLFWTRYAYGNSNVKASIIGFAKLKLLGGVELDTSSLEKLDFHSRLAPLAARLPLEFNSVSSDGRDAVLTHVGSHMRICLTMSRDNGTVHTFFPSEPILMEAAMQIMSLFRLAPHPNGGLKAPFILNEFMKNRQLSKGDRGELASMLLLLMTRDMVPLEDESNELSLPYVPSSTVPSNMTTSFRRIKTSSGSDESIDVIIGMPEAQVPSIESLPDPPTEQLPRLPRPSDFHHHPIKVKAYLRKLFKEEFVQIVLDTLNAMGDKLGDILELSWIHFTHFIKIKDFALVSPSFLASYMLRGAAIILEDGHKGADLIIPVCYNSEEIKPENMTCITIQIKNWKVPPTNAQANIILDDMNPWNVGIFPKDDKANRPVVNLLMCIGGREWGVTTPKPNSSATGATYRNSFGIVAWGLFTETFQAISGAEEEVWAELISRFDDRVAEEVFIHKKKTESVARRMEAGLRMMPEHWQGLPQPYRDANEKERVRITSVKPQKKQRMS